MVAVRALRRTVGMCANSMQTSQTRTSVVGLPVRVATRCQRAKRRIVTICVRSKPSKENMTKRSTIEWIASTGGLYRNPDDKVYSSNTSLDNPFIADDLRQQEWRPKHESFVGRLWGSLLYHYYNWRKNNLSDLQLFGVINLMLILGFSWLKLHVLLPYLDEAPDDGLAGWWSSLYSVLCVVVGQNLPEDAELSVVEQAFAVMTAFIGVASFALVLAIVEQVVLEGFETNVKKGSMVFEEGHIVLLAWGVSHQDIVLLQRMMGQLCLAYRRSGGVVITVLSRREKLEMEEVFNKAMPEMDRWGSKFVFRQGSPLIASDLRKVAAPKARACVILSDNSKGPDDADAQVLRTAILLDEMDFPGFGTPDPRNGHVIAQIRKSETKDQLNYACSSRIIPLSTTFFIADRVACMVQQPLVALTSQIMFNFQCSSKIYLEKVPGVAALTFGEVPYYFPDGIVVGYFNTREGVCIIAPPPPAVIRHDDQLIMFRPTSYATNQYQALAQPITVTCSPWNVEQYIYSAGKDLVLGDIGTNPINRSISLPFGMPQSPSNGSSVPTNGKELYRTNSIQDENVFRASMDGYSYELQNRVASSDVFTKGFHFIPAPASRDFKKILVCNWGDSTFMQDFIGNLDHGPNALPWGSEIIFLNTRPPNEVNAVLSKRFTGHVTFRHVQGNPLHADDISTKVNINDFSCVVVLCDSSWDDPDLNEANGIAMVQEEDALRIDSLVLKVQLHVRQALERCNIRHVNIMTQKMSFDAVTRFEDPTRPPVGVTVNLMGHAATLISEAVYNPDMLRVVESIASKCDVYPQDSSWFTEKNESVSYWELMSRVQAIGQVLLGWYEVPTNPDASYVIYVNPKGHEWRDRKRVWNKGDKRLKLMTLAINAERLRKVNNHKDQLSLVNRMPEEAAP